MRKVRIIIALLFLLPFFSTSAFADGMVIPPQDYWVRESDQKAVVYYEKGIETLVLSIKFSGDAQDFAWVIPAPNRPEVEKAREDLFTNLEELTQPRWDGLVPMLETMGGGGKSLPEPVIVWETKKIDIYEITVLSSTDSDALAKWLNEHGYLYPTSYRYLLNEYIDDGWFFVAVKVDTSMEPSVAESKLKTGHAAPLKLTFEAKQPIYPLKLSSVIGEKGVDIIEAQSFEGSFGEWYSQGAVVVSSEDSYHGSYSVKFIGGLSGVSNPQLYRYFYDLRSGENYTLSAYIKGNAEAGQVYLSVQGLSGTVSSEKLTPSSDWERVKLTFTAQGSGSDYVYVNVDGLKDSEAVFVDAVQLEKGSKLSEFTQTTEFSQYSNYLSITLYTFGDYKMKASDYETQYAGWLLPKAIEKLSVDKNGEPWVKTKGKKYLTKLYDSTAFDEITEDIILLQADDNKTVGRGRRFVMETWKWVVLLGVPLMIEIMTVILIFGAKFKSWSKILKG